MVYLIIFKVKLRTLLLFFFYFTKYGEWDGSGTDSMGVGRDGIFFGTTLRDWDGTGIFLWEWDGTGVKNHSCVIL